jgi:hypothetical protein
MAKRQNTFLIKRSNVPGKVPNPGDLQLGELALNTADVILYASGTTANQILPIGWDRLSTLSGGTVNGDVTINGFVSATTYYNLPQFSGDYLPLSGGTVYGDTYFTSGLTASTLTVTGLTQTYGITSTAGVTFKQVTINSTYSATTEDYMIDVSGGTFTVYLPSAVGIQGRLLVVKNNGGGAVTVLPTLGQNIDDKAFVILGETNTIQLASNGSNWVAISYNISTVNSSTGVFEFTGLTKVSSTQFYVSPVKGWIVDDTTNPLSPQLYYIDYSGGTYTDNYVTTDFETFIYLTSGETISQQPIPLTEQQRRQNIFLGKVGHPDKTSINLVFSQPDFVLSPLAQLRDMFVPINLINGGVVPSTNGANLKFNTNAGYIYGLGINFTNDTLQPNALYVPGTNPCTFQYRTQTGGTVTNVTDIDPLNYDVGGVITPITGTKATNQRIYLLQNGTIRVMYGQEVYNTLVLAIEALQTESFTPFPNFVNNAVLIGILTVLSTATDLTDTSKARFFFASKFGETVGAAGGTSTTNLQQSYNNSSNPEIITNVIQGGVQFRGGTGTNTDKNIIIENNSGTETAFIRADGYGKFTTLSATTIGGSGNCVTDLYISNIHSCSPLNIQPNDEGNVYFGSTSGVTIDLSNNRLGVGIANPTAKLHVNNTSSSNSFLVEDDTNPDSTPFVIDNLGNVGIGTGTPSEKLEVSGKTKTTTFQLTTTPTAGYVLTSDASGNGTWQVGGPTLRNVTATTTFATPNETVNCTGNTFTVNLPTAVGIQGTTYTLVNSGTGVITLQPNGLETINGSLSIDLSIQYISRTVQSDGSNWIII